MHLQRFAVVATFAAALVAGSTTLSAHTVYRYVGTITKVSFQTGMLTIRHVEYLEGGGAKWQTMELPIASNLSVTRNGTPVMRSEVRVGVTVILLAEENDVTGVFEATDLMLVPPIKALNKKK